MKARLNHSPPNARSRYQRTRELWLQARQSRNCCCDLRSILWGRGHGQAVGKSTVFAVRPALGVLPHSESTIVSSICNTGVGHYGGHLPSPGWPNVALIQRGIGGQVDR